MAGTVKVSNISSKATIKEIEEFFSFSGQIIGINLNSDGDESQTAYVTFMDQDSVKIAILLSGSTILDKEVIVSPCPFSATEASTVEPATGSPEMQAQGSVSTQTRPRVINRAQEIVRSMLSRGFSLGKDAVKRANSLDERRKDKTDDGDALKDMSNGSSFPQKREDVKVADDAQVTQEVVSKSDESKVKGRALDDVKDNAHDDMSVPVGDGGEKDGDGVQQAFQEGRQAKGGSNNVRMSVQKCYKHVWAINEKLQLGQRTMSALATAQQGVANAGSAVASNKLVSAGGVWVSGALSRVSLRNPHLNNDGGEGSPSQHHEHVQLTEMTTFSGHKSENN